VSDQLHQRPSDSPASAGRRRASLRGGVGDRVAEQDLGAVAVVMDQYAVDEAMHEGDAEAVAGWPGIMRRVAPVSVVADFDP
jgi:hypothetical protein